MKKIIALLITITLFSCKKEIDCCVNFEPVDIKLIFNHNWDGIPITSSDFNHFKFTTKNGETISIEKLRYLVSNISIDTRSKNYQLINIGENTGSEITYNQIPQGLVSLNFTFGFADEDNTDGIYQDLNSTSFNVPSMLGGGYHFMQFDGKFKDINNADTSFNYHAIRAVDRTDPDNLIFEDTSFEVNLGEIEITNNVIIEIEVNIAEWFKNPNQWNLNELNTVLMPNFEAQKIMSANGKTVFSLGEISQYF